MNLLLIAYPHEGMQFISLNYYSTVSMQKSAFWLISVFRFDLNNRILVIPQPTLVSSNLCFSYTASFQYYNAPILKAADKKRAQESANRLKFSLKKEGIIK